MDPVLITTLKKLHSYWSEKKEHRLFPARKDLDPLDFHYALGNVSLIDVERDENTHNPIYRVRLLGSNIQERIGSSFINRNLDDFPEQDSLYKMRLAYKKVLDTKEPLAYPSFFKYGEKEQPFVCCIWPLSSDGEKVDMLLCCREQIFDKALVPNQDHLTREPEIWPYQQWGNTPLFSALMH